MSAISVGLNAMDDKEDQCCDLTFKQRLIGGGICMGVGILLSILSFISFASGDLTTFAIIYTLGTIASIAGSFFIVGPKKHMEAFKDETLRIPHIVSTGVLVGCILMVFISALAIKSTALAIIFVIAELIALVFFTLTLKKVMWTAFKTLFNKCFKCGGN